MMDKYKPIKDKIYRYKNGSLVKYVYMNMRGEWVLREIGSGTEHNTDNPDDFETLHDIRDLKALVDLALDSKDKEWFMDIVDQMNLD